ncbi:hypothetical protein FT663_02704 [Candidozyma haemuli var. vulneris]|nr:hypothetical protein FT662_03818 [[Candida] haemuloni var. vulneris]KAF3991518.1 hypothetical protein FT663_02704 [[Candida] haemuloni var. vulneris]
MVCPLFDSTIIGFKAPTHDGNSLRGTFNCTKQTINLIQRVTVLADSTTYLAITCQPNIWSSCYKGTPFVADVRGGRSMFFERTLSSISEESSLYSSSQDSLPTSPESSESRISFNRTFMGTDGPFNVGPGSRFFVIKSFSIEDIEASWKNKIWTSTDLGNKRLNKAYVETDNGSVFLFFSVNASMKFCGVARMEDKVDFAGKSNVWEEHSRWNSVFPVNWLISRDISNRKLKHLTVPKNENKPVTNSRDTQELPYEVGLSMLEIFVE